MYVLTYICIPKVGQGGIKISIFGRGRGRGSEYDIELLLDQGAAKSPGTAGTAGPASSMRSLFDLQQA